MKKISWPVLFLFVIVIEIIGLLSGFLSGDIKASYEALLLPSFAPPGWIFGVVWPVLYAMMGIAVYLIYYNTGTLKNNAVILFAVQLVLNFLWPIIFFRFDLYWAAAAVIIVMDILVMYMITLFYKISRPAAWLMIPYLLWLLFATYLNIGVALLA